MHNNKIILGNYANFVSLTAASFSFNFKAKMDSVTNNHNPIVASISAGFSSVHICTCSLQNETYFNQLNSINFIFYFTRSGTYLTLNA